MGKNTTMSQEQAMRIFQSCDQVMKECSTPRSASATAKAPAHSPPPDPTFTPTQTGRGKVSLDEFCDFANRKPR